jgi:hypothetical protein
MHNHNNHAMPGKTFSLTQGNDRFQGGKGNDTIVAANDTLSAGDVISGGGGTNTLSLIGGGSFDLSLPAKLDDIDVVQAKETAVDAGSIPDATGDFIPSFTGAQSPDLDVLSFFTTFDGTTFHIGGTMNGDIGKLATSLYVIGFDRGAGTPRFAAIGHAGVLFDSVVTMTGKGAAAVNLLAPTASSTPLPENAVHISGASFEIDVPAALLQPGASIPPEQYKVNLWPRDASQAGNAAVSDFAPDNSVLGVSPTPAAQTITLREGTHLTVNVAPGDLGAGITIIGADNADVINLASGSDTVIVGSDRETVNGKGGSNVFQVNAETIGARISGGGGKSELLITGGNSPTGDNKGDDEKTGDDKAGDGGNNIVMGHNITDVATVKLDAATSLRLNGIGFLHAVGSDGADTIKAGGINQTLSGGKGADTLAGFTAGSDTFLDTAAGLNGDTIQRFVISDRIDITDLGFAAAQLTAVATAGNTMVTLSSGATTTAFTLTGTFSADGFKLATDGAAGTLLTHS